MFQEIQICSDHKKQPQEIYSFIHHPNSTTTALQTIRTPRITLD